MNPKLYETLGAEHQADLRREALGGHRLASSRDGVAADRGIPGLHPRRWLDRLTVLWDGARADVARPGRDLGSTRRPELRQDVLDVTARGLGRDAK